MIFSEITLENTINCLKNSLFFLFRPYLMGFLIKYDLQRFLFYELFILTNLFFKTIFE